MSTSTLGNCTRCGQEIFSSMVSIGDGQFHPLCSQLLTADADHADDLALLRARLASQEAEIARMAGERDAERAAFSDACKRSAERACEDVAAQLAAVTAEASAMREALARVANCNTYEMSGDLYGVLRGIARDALASHAGSALLARLKASEEVIRFADLACAVLLHSANRFHTLNDVPRAKEAIDIRNKLVDALAAYDAHATDAKEQK